MAKGGVRELREALLGAADQVLMVLGESATHTIYRHIERKYNVSREEILDRPEIFHEVLDSLFGAGAKVIERLIARSLCDRLSLDFKAFEDWTLVDYVRNSGRLSVAS